MTLITLAAGITLTGWSERTFYRKFADRSMARDVKNGRSMISFDLIKPHLCIPLAAEDIAILGRACAGDADAQNEVALIFLANEKPEGAIYWLELAAKQGHTDAMHWLGRCYINGDGFSQDDNLGIMWLAKAAALGHSISKHQMNSLRSWGGAP